MQILQSLKLQWMSLRFIYLSMLIFSFVYSILGCIFVKDIDGAIPFLLAFILIFIFFCLWIGYFYSSIGNTYMAIKHSRKAFVISNLIGNLVMMMLFFFCYLMIRIALVIGIHQSIGGIHFLVGLTMTLSLFTLGNVIGSFLKKKEYFLLIPILLFVLLIIFLHIPLKDLFFNFSLSLLTSFKDNIKYVLPSYGYILLFITIWIITTIVNDVRYLLINATKAYDL